MTLSETPVTSGPLGILTPNGPRIVGSMSGGGIPVGLAVAFIPLQAEWGDRQRTGLVRYSVTHVLSGRGIGPGFESIHDARHLAEALADVCDWSLPEAALQMLPNIQAHVSAVLDRVLTELDEGDL